MPLPSLEKAVATFDVTIPSTGTSAKFRPFLVKEEKLLLIAVEADDESTMLNAICQVLTGCAVSPLKVETLAVFDIEYIFLKLRARSVSEVAELRFRCQNQIELTPEELQKRSSRLKSRREDDGAIYATCDNIVSFSINLDQIEVKHNPDHKRNIMLTQNMGVTMRYPNVEMDKRRIKRGGDKEGVAEVLDGIASCIESVYDQENVYSNFSLKEMAEWLDNLTQPQFIQIQEFFETMPKLSHDLDFKCDKCGHSETIHVEGLAAFFG